MNGCCGYSLFNSLQIFTKRKFTALLYMLCLCQKGQVSCLKITKSIKRTDILRATKVFYLNHKSIQNQYNTRSVYINARLCGCHPFTIQFFPTTKKQIMQCICRAILRLDVLYQNFFSSRPILYRYLFFLPFQIK